jgi:B12-binding domain/radical SAM domain protein
LYFKGKTKLEKASCVDINKYLPISTFWRRFGPLELTRGCFYRCKFCATASLFSLKVRHRNIEVITETVKLMLKYGYNQIRFLSPNAFSYFSKGKRPNLEAIEMLLKKTRELIGKKGKIFFGSFPSEVRPEFVNERVIKLVKKFVDNDNIVIGVQTASNSLLKKIERTHTKEEGLEATRIILKEGFKAYVDIIFGFPQETFEDRIETIKYMQEIIKMGAKPHLHYFLPLPGSAFYKKMPAPLEKEVLKILNRWEAEGKIFGCWRNQMRLRTL